MLSLGSKKDGGPNVKFFEAPEILTQLDGVKQWLLKNCKKYVQTDPLINKSLVTLVVQLLQFQEDNLGKNISKPMTRFSMKCFLDLKPGGDVCHILANAYYFKQKQGWQRFDFPSGKSESRMDRTVDMLMAVEHVLIQNRCAIVPSVFVRLDVDTNTAAKVKEVVKKHQEIVVENEADATHIICPPVDPMEEEYVLL